MDREIKLIIPSVCPKTFRLNTRDPNPGFTNFNLPGSWIRKAMWIGGRLGGHCRPRGFVMDTFDWGDWDINDWNDNDENCVKCKVRKRILIIVNQADKQTHTYVCIYIHIHTNKHTHFHTPTYIQTYIHTYAHTLTYTCKHIY